LKLAWCGNNAHEIEAVVGRTPFTDLLEAEERAHLDAHEIEEQTIKIEAISALLSYFFAPINGKMPNPLEVLQKVYVLCYTIAPANIEGWSLNKIAKCFDSSRQCFSKKLLKQNELLNLRSRNQKSDTAVETYRKICTENHRVRIATAKEQARKDYLAQYRLTHREKLLAYQKEYRARFKERLNLIRRQRRAARNSILKT